MIETLQSRARCFRQSNCLRKRQSFVLHEAFEVFLGYSVLIVIFVFGVFLLISSCNKRDVIRSSKRLS